MADVSTEYLLSTNIGNITFNQGDLGDGTDKYWLTSVQGLDGPVIRAPVDPFPFADGGIIHPFWKGPRRVVMDGVLIIESDKSHAVCQQIRNDMVTDLDGFLRAILVDAGTLIWTPAGQPEEQLNVVYEVGLSVTYSDNYAVANFSFGLVSGEPDPTIPVP